MELPEAQSPRERVVKTTAEWSDLAVEAGGTVTFGGVIVSRYGFSSWEGLPLGNIPVAAKLRRLLEVFALKWRTVNDRLFRANRMNEWYESATMNYSLGFRR
jgi:hypothetical protein